MAESDEHPWLDQPPTHSALPSNPEPSCGQTGAPPSDGAYMQAPPPSAALAAASATHASIGTAGRPSAAAASAVTGVDPARSATDSDTEEDEEAVPGTPPDDYPNKRPCTDGAHGGSFDGSGW